MGLIDYRAGETRPNLLMPARKAFPDMLHSFWDQKNCSRAVAKWSNLVGNE
jgi:hypothetical protein